MIAGIRACRHGQVTNGKARRRPVGTQSDGEDGNLCFCGQLDGGVRGDAGILSAIAQNDDAQDRSAALGLKQLPQRLAEPRFGTGGGE